MRITCPECQFSRDINEDKIPERSVVATCPKCKAKFRFRGLPEEEVVENTSTPPSSEAPRNSEQPVAQQEESASTPEKFPELPDPTEQPSDELWRKISDMPPPPEPGKATQEKSEPSAFENQEDVPEQDRQNGRQQPTVEVPFERLDQFGFFPGLFATIKRVLLSPHLFFDVMPLGKGIGRPLIFAVLILVMHDVLQAAFFKAGLSPAADLGSGATQAAADFNPFALLPFSPLMWVVVLFISAGIHHLLLMALKASDGKFEATFRAAAYATAPIILAYIPIPFEVVYKSQMMIIFIWNMAITVIGWKCLHRTSFLKAGLAAAIPLLVLAAAVLTSGQGISLV